MKHLFTGLLTVVICIGLYAQSPQKINYQTLVRNAAGDPLASTSVSFRISILEASALGTAVYVETQSATTNAFGLATLNIGAGTPVTGTFPDIEWGTDLHFIKVEFDPTGGSSFIFMGTSQLLSVPYALYSKEGESVTNNTLEGLGIRGDSLRIAQQDADSSNVLMWTGFTWAPVNINILIGGSPLVVHNTLDQAYDQDNPGAGRTITASDGAVRIRNSGDNDGLLIEDTLVPGTNSTTHLRLNYGGTMQAAHIDHTFHGTGLLIENDSTTTGTAKNNLVILNPANAEGVPTAAGGRALLARTLNQTNNRPTIEGNSLGLGHGVFGNSGQNDWTTTVLNLMPAAGVAGFSGTGNVGTSGSIDPFDPPSYRRGRIGVAGLSKVNYGVWGMTNVEGSFASNSPDSIIAGVVGVESPYLGTISNSQARYDHFGVAGLTPNEGSGVLGIGSGYGVVGWGGFSQSATAAGVWGNTRLSSWTLTQSEYSLVQTGLNNKNKVGVLGTSADRTGVWGESKTSVGVVATAGGIFAHNLIELESNVALFGATPAGTAAKFVAAPDTSNNTQLMLVKFAEKNGNAGYFEIRSDTVMEAIVKIEHRSKGPALEIDANHLPPGPDIIKKGPSIFITHRSDSAAATYIETKGRANSLHIKSNVNDSAAIFVNDTNAVGIRSITQAGKAGVIGRSGSSDKLSAGIVAYGASHADSAAALEIRDGAIRVTGPSKPAGRIIDYGTGGDTLGGIVFMDSDMSTFKGGCPPCLHDHATGFYKDYPITNDLLSKARSMIYLTPRAKVNFLGGVTGFAADYDAITAHVLEIEDGSAMIRVTCFKTPIILDEFNTVVYFPEYIILDYLIVNF